MTRASYSPLFIKNQIARCEFGDGFSGGREVRCKHVVIMIHSTGLGIQGLGPKLVCEEHARWAKLYDLESGILYFTIRRIRE